MKKENIEIINLILKNIENNIEYINVSSLVEDSGFSYFHFHRIFKAYVGENLNKYIKRILLEKAAFSLQYKNKRITDIALSSGYSSSSSFNKAFKEFFLTSPSLYKKQKIRKMEYKMISPIEIVNIKDIEVYSLKHVGPYNEIGKAFEILMKFIYTQKIKFKKDLMNKDSFSYSIAYDDPNVTEASKLRADACVSASDDVILENEIKRAKISGGKYAVFIHKGSYENLKNTYNDIFSSYVKDQNISLRDVPVFEKYLNRDPRRTKVENLKTLIHIPIN